MSYTRYLFQVCIGVCSSRSLMEFPLKSKSFALWEYGVEWRTLALGLSRLSSVHGYSQCCRFLPCHSLRGENVHHISMFTFHCVSCRLIGCGIVKNALDNILYNMKQIATWFFASNVERSFCSVWFTLPLCSKNGTLQERQMVVIWSCCWFVCIPKLSRILPAGILLFAVLPHMSRLSSDLMNLGCK